MRQQTASISARIEADRVYAEAQTALASLLVSIGHDFIPASIKVDDPNVLAKDLQPILEALQTGRFTALETSSDLRAASMVKPATLAHAENKDIKETKKVMGGNDAALPHDTRYAFDKKKRTEEVSAVWRSTTAEGSGPVPADVPAKSSEQKKLSDVLKGWFGRPASPAPKPAMESTAWRQKFSNGATEEVTRPLSPAVTLQTPEAIERRARLDKMRAGSEGGCLQNVSNCQPSLNSESGR